MILRISLCLTLGFLTFGCTAIPPKTDLAAPATAAATEQNDQTPNQSSERNLNFPVGKTELPKAVNVSTAEKDVELQRKIDETIETSLFKNARWGVFAVSLKDGRVVVARDAQKLFNPASTQKLFTTAVALDKLGANYQWKTSIVIRGSIGADGALNGDLILKGRGAPDFDEQDFASLIEQLKAKGVRRVAGKIVGDASFFRADNLGDGWTWNEAQWYYGAEPSALSFSDNTILIEVLPPSNDNENVTVKTTPEAGFVRVNINAKTSAKATTQTVGVHRKLDSNNFEIYGESPRGKSFGVRTAMHQPELWAASEFKKALQKAGITVAGDAASFDWRTANGELENLTEIAAVSSDSLAEIVKRTNKNSINLNSELMLRTIGEQARQQIAADDQKRLMFGDDQIGAAQIKNWLAEKGVATGETEIHDGSGLSRLNFVSPEVLGRLLVFAAQMKDREAFIASLPIAGVDGTLGGRLPKFKNRVFAKTGSITYVNALAGYAQIAGDETLAFVIFCNNETSKENSVTTVDQIASFIAGSGDSETMKSKR